MKHSRLTLLICLALILGVLFGHFAPHLAVKMRAFALIFLRMVKMIIAPLLFATLVTGIAGHGDIKKLGKIGDISVMGIVSERSALNYALLNTTRLNLVYTMAETISSAIADLLYNRLDLSENFLKNG